MRVAAPPTKINWKERHYTNIKLILNHFIEFVSRCPVDSDEQAWVVRIRSVSNLTSRCSSDSRQRVSAACTRRFSSLNASCPSDSEARNGLFFRARGVGRPIACHSF